MGFSLNFLRQGTSKERVKEDEVSIIEGCLNDERWAQKLLYEKAFPNMMGVCLRYANCEEDAKDILNDGFIKVFRYLHKYKIGTSLIGWMRRIMINTAIDYYRKELRHRSEDIDQIYHYSTSDADAVSNLTEMELLNMINDLPTSYRTVFNLYAIEGFSHKEVAKMLGISESTSRSNLVKARAKLKVMVKNLYK